MIQKLRSIFSDRIDVSDTLIKTLGIFGVVNFPLFYFVNKLFLERENEFVFLRLSAFLLSVPLLFIDYWPPYLKRYKLFYWYSYIFYIFPFFSTYMFIENYGSNMWFTKVIIGLFWLILVTDWMTVIVILPLGVLTGWITHYLINGPDHIDMSIMTELSINYVWAVLIATVFSRGKDNIQKERLNAMKSLAGTIAHEMRTPFLGIRSSAGGIKRFLPSLIDGYKKAKEANLGVSPISEKNLHQLIETPDNLDKITLSASLVIDMLLTSLKGEIFTNKHYEVKSIKSCVSEMFQEYPLTNDEKSLLNWTDNPDFTFHGNDLLMKHVLFNLMKNGLYAIKAANKGKIMIWTETTPKGNYLYFKDTGTGMSPAMVSNIFDRFYSQTHHGTGIGLAFCKAVMTSFGGTISCESKEGEYTIFILKFPIPLNA